MQILQNLQHGQNLHLSYQKKKGVEITMENKEKDFFKGKQAIIVDDDQDFLVQIETYLNLFGFSVETADSEKNGKVLIKKGGYDVAVFDLIMENQDSGFILAYESKKENADIPVIMVSSVTSVTGMQFDSITGESKEWIKADILLNKDIRKEQLFKELEKLVN